MKNSTKFSIILSLVIVIIFAAWIYIKVLEDLSDTKKQLISANIELAKVNKENELLQKSLRLTEEEMAQVKADLANTQKALQALDKKYRASEQQAAELLIEKQRLEARLASLVELKAAIKQVKARRHSEAHKRSLEQTTARQKKQQAIDEQKLALGNRGFMLKDGKSLSLPARVKIEVLPAN